jgi:hypothetical protein
MKPNHGSRLILMVLILGGCSIVGLDDNGEIERIDGDAGLVVPDSFQVGVFGDVHFRTAEGRSCKTYRVEVRVEGLFATITPWVKPSPGDYCNDDLASFTHVARVRFNQSGSGTVRLRGRLHVSPPRDTLIERPVHIR